MEDQTKICYKCGEEKYFSDFPVDKSKKDGRKGECKDCRNAHLRFLREGKKTSLIPSAPAKLTFSPIPESEKFRKDSIEFFTKSFGKTDDLNMEFVLKLSENAIKFHEELIYPPTNKFKVLDSKISGGGSFEINSSIIISKLSIFLIQKRNKIIDVSGIKIIIDPKYDITGALIITLPDNILLSYREIEEFLISLTVKNIEKKKHQVEVKIEDVNLRPFVFDFPNVVHDFLLKKCGYDVDFLYIKLVIRNIDSIIVEWPDEYSISESSIDLLQKNIFDYVLAGI
jgi:hypothetical protein